jgi:hypothetical protein
VPSRLSSPSPISFRFRRDFEFHWPDEDGIVHELKRNQVGQDLVATLDAVCHLTRLLLQGVELRLPRLG